MSQQPKQIFEIKELLLIARRKDAKCECQLFIQHIPRSLNISHLIKFNNYDETGVKVKKNKGETKFKVRCSRYLYTFVCKDQEKAQKLKQSLPPGKSSACWVFCCCYEILCFTQHIHRHSSFWLVLVFFSLSGFFVCLFVCLFVVV